MNKRRLLSILTCLALCLTLLPPATARAAEGETIHVGGVELTTTEEKPILYAKTDSSSGTVTPGGSEDSYNIKWDGATLTLNNAVITQGSYKGAAIYYHDRYTAIHLVLMGESTVTGPNSSEGSCGIDVSGDLTIDGSGTLTVTGGDVTVTDTTYAISYGIDAPDIIISSGTVTATGGTVSGNNAISYGIDASDITISGGIVNATGGTAASGNADDSDAESCGIYADNVIVSGGAVTATGGSASGNSLSFGIIAENVTVSDGTATATGGEVSGNNAYSCGINATNGLTISGGEVTAEGATQAVLSFTGTVTVDPEGGEQIEVTAGAGKDSAAAIIGSPFTSEEEISDSSISSAQYFHSIAEKAGDPGPDDSNIYVGGVGLIGDKDTPAYALTDKSGKVTTTGATADNYNIMWDGETLTLNNADITQGSHENAAIYCGEDAGIHLVLVGESTVTGPSGVDASRGIYTRGELTISGSGSLTVTGGDVTAAGTDYAESCGIDADNVIVSGGTVNADGGTASATGNVSYAYSCGIDADNVIVSGGIVNADGGTASATGNVSYACSYGISVYGSIDISGGAVTADGGEVTFTGSDGYACSYGISVYGSIDISDGIVNADGGTASATGNVSYACSYGIYVTRETLAISGGIVNADGGTATGSYAESCGIYVTHGLTISGGTVTADGGTATGSYAESCGIYFKEKATISGGEVTAEGATQAVRSFTGSVIIDPAEGQQIAVTAGAGKDSAAAIIGSPFTSEEEISDSSISGAQYFHSIAEEAGDPGPDDPNLYVGGVGLTGDKDTPAYALTNGGTVTKDGATADNYNIKWDGETLTLKNAAIRGGHQFRPGESAAIYYSGQDDITLKLSGNNTVTGPGGGDTEVSCGVYAGSDLTISGDGTLNVSGGEVSANDAYSYGIFTPCDITISGGSVTAEGGTASTTGASYAESFGIFAYNITISGGTVNADGGTASATGNESYACSYGIYARDVIVSNGEVTATGGTASAGNTGGHAESYGIYAYDLTVSDGEVTATGGTASADSEASSRGIYVDMEATISGGIVNADGGKVTFTGSEGYAESCGISVRDLTVSGGTVNATGGTATGGSEESYGLSLPGTFTISGGTVTIAGKTASFDQSKSILPNLSVLIAPQPKTQIRVQSGPNQENAVEITDSPFQEETEITDLASAAGVAYFKSAAEPARYSVTLHPNGGTIAGGKDVTSYLCGTGASLPGAGDVTRSGYRFAGWYADESLTDGPYTQISAADAGDMAFYARWVRRSSGGGGSSSSSRPAGPSTGHSDGWTDIREEIGSAEDGDTVTIDMNGETEVPAEIFGEIAGKDITVELDMGGGVTWTVDGRDVPEDVSLSDLDLGVDMDTSGISVDVINTVTGEYGAVQVSLEHDGAFGFALTLTAPLGRENAGYWANLYHYDEGEETLTFETSARIAADGSAALRMTHASQYAIVIDEKSHALPFEDVGTGAWYSDAVAYVYRNGLMSGTSASTFSPDAAITRAQLVTILWRMAGSPQVNGLMDFDDVSQDAYYAEAVRWAASEGIAGGYGNGLFGSDDPITREQMAAILYRFAQHMGYDVSIGEDTNILSYTDAPDVSGYAVAALQWACGAGIIRGTGDGSTLTPQGGATRAQAAVILTRFCAQSQ